MRHYSYSAPSPTMRPEDSLEVAFSEGKNLRPGDACRLLQSVARLAANSPTRVIPVITTPAFQWAEQQVMLSSRRFRSRQLTQVWWSLASLSSVKEWKAEERRIMIDALVKQTIVMLVDFDAMGLTQCVWAHSKLGVEVCTDLLKPLLDSVASKIQDFNAQDCANMLWAFAKQHASAKCGGNSGTMIRMKSISLLLFSHAASSGVVTRLKAMEIASVYWAGGSLRLKAKAEDCAMLNVQLEGLSAMLSPKHIAMIMSGIHVFTIEGNSIADGTELVLHALLERVTGVISKFNPQTICDLFGTCTLFFKELAPSIVSSGDDSSRHENTEIEIAKFATHMLNSSVKAITEFMPRDVSTISSHLADVLTSSKSLQFQKYMISSSASLTGFFTVLKDHFVDSIREYSPIDISRTLRALVNCAQKIHVKDISMHKHSSVSSLHTGISTIFSEESIPKIQKHIVALLPSLIPQDLSHILWAHAQGNFTMPRKLGRSLQARAVETIADFTPQGIATVLWALAKGGQRALPLFVDAVVHKLKQYQESQMGAQEVSTILWAVASMMDDSSRSRTESNVATNFKGFHALIPLLCDYVVKKAEQMNPTDIVNTLWGLATISQKKSTNEDLLYSSAVSSSQALFQGSSVFSALTANQLALVVWSCGKLSRKEMQRSNIEEAAFISKIINELSNMHAQNIGMVAWGIVAANLPVSKKLVKALTIRGIELNEEMNWQTVSHMEYFLRHHVNYQSGKKKRSKKIYTALTLRATNLINAMRRDNRKEYKDMENRVLEVAANQLVPLLNRQMGSTNLHSVDAQILVVDSSRRFLKGLKKIVQNSLKARSISFHAWNRFSQGKYGGSSWVCDDLQKNVVYSCAIVRLGIFHDAFDMVLEGVAKILGPGAPLWIYGTEREGIGSIGGKLASHKGMFSMPYFQSAVVRGQTARTLRTEAQFSSDGRASVDGVDSWRTRTRLDELTGTNLKNVKWYTYPGLFAGGKMDMMTSFLLRTMNSQQKLIKFSPGEKTYALDFCCGSGTILRYLAETWLNQNVDLRVIEALDADALAIRAAKKNCKSCSAFYISDCWESISEEKSYDLVVSNPPVHSFKLDSFDVIMELIQGCIVGRRLRPGGTLWIVAQNYIPVGRMLEINGGGMFESVDVFSDARFSVWVATRRQESHAVDIEPPHKKVKVSHSAGGIRQAAGVQDYTLDEMNEKKGKEDKKKKKDKKGKHKKKTKKK